MQPVRRVVQEVADREGTCPADLPPLYESLDPDALDQLLASADDTTITVEFMYDEYLVRVGEDGDVEVLG